VSVRYIVMVPVEIKLDSPSQLRDVVRSIKNQGAFPQYESYGKQCYSWRVRCDKAHLKNTRKVSP
jgi:hypothetical protein